MNNTLAQFKTDRYFHVYNRSNNKEPIFLSDENRSHFLNLFRTYLDEVIEVFAFSLLKNHFHFCIKVKSLDEIIYWIDKTKENDRTLIMSELLSNVEDEHLIHKLVSHQFSRFFNSYTQGFNNWNSRKGNLFNRPFKRSLLTSDIGLKLKIYYVHHNARKHGLIKNFLEHSWNSYHEIALSSSQIIDSEKVISLFGGHKKFEEFHRENLLPQELTLTGF